LRLDRGWTQEQLAQHSGLSVRTIQRIERGSTATLESLKCLAAVFETDVRELVQEKTVTETPYAGQAEQEAIQYVQNLKGFHLNWIIFAVVMPFLCLLPLFIGTDWLWVGITAAGWLFGIAMHAATLFGLFNIFDGKWEQREFQKRMNRHDR
jgi:transcriptional regulator with XRE-family HTH domain